MARLLYLHLALFLFGFVTGQGGSGYNPGDSGRPGGNGNGGSGYNPGNGGNYGGGRPDNNGNHGGSGYNPGRPDKNCVRKNDWALRQFVNVNVNVNVNVLVGTS